MAMKEFTTKQIIGVAIAGLATVALNDLSMRIRQEAGMSATMQRVSGTLGIVGPASMVTLAERLTPEQAVVAIWTLMGVAGLHYIVRSAVERAKAVADATDEGLEVGAWLSGQIPRGYEKARS